jgi:fructose-specific phosphotransferase system IIC component
MKRWKDYTQKQEKEVFSKLYKFGVLYFGTALMMISPFIIDSIYGKMGMIIGLILITIQTQKTKQYNLSLLNAVGIVGYLYALLKNIL